MTAVSALRRLAVALIALAAAPASARVVEFPLQLDHGFVRPAHDRDVVRRPRARHARVARPEPVQRRRARAPAALGRDGKLHVVADFDAKLGAPVGNWCLNATRRKGILDAALEARLHRTLPIVEFRVVTPICSTRRAEALHGRTLGLGALAGAPAARDDQDRSLPAVAELKTFLPCSSRAPTSRA
jgi:hypothetical protein